MEIIVHSRSLDRRHFIEHLSEFYIDQLNLGRSRKTVTIYTVPRLLKERKMSGCTIRNDGNVAILIDSQLSYAKLVTTLAHEFVHVKQIALGHLRPLKENEAKKWVWMGKIYDNHDYTSPWEKEAYSREGVLTAAVMNYIINHSD